MHPVLLQIGSIKIYSYGVFVALGFLAALWVSGREIDRVGMDREKFYDMGIWVVLSAIVGARLFHVLVYWREYAAAPLEIFKLWNGGLVFYGGFLAATAACIVFLRRNRIPFLPVADASAIGLPLGLAFGRLGCTSAGCCFGKPCELPWAITFTHPGSLAPLNVPLHPTQIYEALAGFAIFGLLYVTRSRFRTPGMRFWTMLILYGAARGLIEIFRDDPRGFLGPFSESQVVSMLLILYAAASILITRGRAKAAFPPGPGTR
ncbi:MAG: prolipoprotein diacylglyceryl transferase [Deltaproteobacteria bacterium]|nr:prolipoprotein diacylglyceryl transferase [Deltaproteobacteria bacterium]